MKACTLHPSRATQLTRTPSLVIQPCAPLSLSQHCKLSLHTAHTHCKLAHGNPMYICMPCHASHVLRLPWQSVPSIYMHVARCIMGWLAYIHRHTHGCHPPMYHRMMMHVVTTPIGHSQYHLHPSMIAWHAYHPLAPWHCTLHTHLCTIHMAPPTHHMHSTTQHGMHTYMHTYINACIYDVTCRHAHGGRV